MRQRLFETVVSGGVSATVTARNGAVLRLFCLKAVYDWPGIASKELPDEDTIFRVKIRDGATKEIAFREITAIEFAAGKQIRMRTKIAGSPAVEGEWIGPVGVYDSFSSKRGEAEAAVSLEGLSQDGRVVRQSLSELRKIEVVVDRP